MKIAYITNEFIAPSETFKLQLVRGLKAGGHNVRVFSSIVGNVNANEFELEVSNTTPSMALPHRFTRKVLSLVLGWTDLHALHREKRRLTRIRLNPVLENYAPDLLFVDYGTEAVHLGDFSRTHGIPIIVHLHGFDATEKFRDLSYRNALAELLADGHHFVVPSEHIRRRLVVEFGQFARIFVVPCVPSFNADYNGDRSPQQQVKRVLAVGRLTPKKSPLTLIEAFRLVAAELDRVKFEIIGDGPLMAQVVERIARYDLQDRIICVGALPHREVVQRLSDCDVFVQHSVTAPNGDQEGMPVSIMEALSFDLPVVATRHSGIPEIVENGVSGLLVREHDYEETAEAIIRILKGEVSISPLNTDATKALLRRDRSKEIERVISSAARVNSEYQSEPKSTTHLRDDIRE